MGASVIPYPVLLWNASSKSKSQLFISHCPIQGGLGEEGKKKEGGKERERKGEKDTINPSPGVTL
jgi:hypothetical protein